VQKESVVFGVAGVFFGLLVGWIIGSQHAVPAAPATPSPAGQSASGSSQPAPALDESRVRALESQAERDPRDAETRIQLGNLYFDSERFTEAVRWYQEALKIDPKNVNASTDLGISYYYMNQPDRALEQFDRSLAIDPKHSKTLLNVGIVRAFGKQDLDGASKAFEQVLLVAPDTPEGRAARQALEGIRSAHPGVGSAPGGRGGDQ
jgi:tetratricopeptide (TPR) repeat protein